MLPVQPLLSGQTPVEQLRAESRRNSEYDAGIKDNHSHMTVGVNKMQKTQD